MNGRLYDPKLHTFLMPDNFVQQPENTQSYNRYAYCINNPLKYTDPSGELFGLDDLAAAIIIGAFIGGASSGAGMIAFGTVAGGVGASLTGGNFWQGAAIGLVVSGLNHYEHQQQVKSEIEKNFPGLIKSMSKIRSYLKNNEEVMKSFTTNSGYTRSQALKIFTLRNLIQTVKVEILSEYGEFRENDSKNVYIDKYLATSLDKGGYVGLGGSRTSLFGTEFLAGVTVMHEFVHQGRFINGLSNMIGRYEAGQFFETAAFGQINGSSTVDNYVKRSGW